MALIAVGVEIPGCSSDAAKEAVSVSSVGPTPAALVGPEEFAARVAEHEVVTINVHVPDEGSIAGTDVWIPFDQVATSTALPQDRSTPLAVYCRSGNMSADAVRDLQDIGYSNIIELDGGFTAWVRAGRSLEPPAT